MMKVSVCMATFNGAKFIEQQIQSILKQLSPDDEIIISDDGSTDSTAEIINGFNDVRIQFFLNTGKKGVAGNFENALTKATGEYIFLSDQDDVWLDKKISTIITELQKYDCVLHNGHLIDGKGDFLNNDLFSIYNTRSGYCANLIRNTYVGCCMAFRSDLLKSILPIPDKITMHDMWIGLLAEKLRKTKIISDNLILYRRHGNNASSTSKKSTYSRYFQLKYRLVMLYYTLLRN